MKKLLLLIFLICISCDNETYEEGFSSIDKYEISSKNTYESGGRVSHTYYDIYARNNIDMIKISTDEISFRKINVHDSILIVTKTIIRKSN